MRRSVLDGEVLGGRLSVRSRWRAHLRTGAALAAALALVAGPSVFAAEAPAAPAAAAASPRIAYAVGVPVCAPARPKMGRCYAMRRELVSRSTPGAEPVALPRAGSRNAESRGPKATIGPAGGITPSDLATAYGFSATATGTGQTVAVVDAYNDPNIAADLATFDGQYSLSSCTESNGCLSVVNQSGGSSLPPDDTTGWSVEESLDVETAHSVCEHCKIILVEATSQSEANLSAAENEAVALGATEVSNSFGFPESDLKSYAADYDHPGVVITASSGDDGYYDFDEVVAGADAVNEPNAPASFSTVVAVGGTSLYLGQTAARQSETVWNDNGPRDYWESAFGEPLGASGGGCSTTESAPAWQKNLSDWSETACGKHRLVADISAVADPLTGFDVYDSFDCGSKCSTGWFTLGGTSLASPLIASMFALAGGSHGVSYPALTLYGHLGSSSLYDVTSGGNGYCGGDGAAACGDVNDLGGGALDCDYNVSGSAPSAGDAACDATSGYDGPSGVGTPNGLGAFEKTGPHAKLAGPTSVSHGTKETWTATTSDPFPKGKVTKYSWNWGDGTAATSTTSGSAAHTYAKAGKTYTITLTVTDSYGQTGTTTYTVKAT